MANHNWYIGQDIVCIKSHSEGYVKNGDVLTIKSLKKGCCVVLIDVGLIDDELAYEYLSECIICSRQTSNGNDNCIWISERLFAPLDTLTDISEIEEILNQPIEQLFKHLKTNNNDNFSKH